MTTFKTNCVSFWFALFACALLSHACGTHTHPVKNRYSTNDSRVTNAIKNERNVPQSSITSNNGMATAPFKGSRPQFQKQINVKSASVKLVQLKNGEFSRVAFSPSGDEALISLPRTKGDCGDCLSWTMGCHPGTLIFDLASGKITSVYEGNSNQLHFPGGLYFAVGSALYKRGTRAPILVGRRNLYTVDETYSAGYHYSGCGFIPCTTANGQIQQIVRLSPAARHLVTWYAGVGNLMKVWSREKKTLICSNRKLRNPHLFYFLNEKDSILFSNGLATKINVAKCEKKQSAYTIPKSKFSKVVKFSKGRSFLLQGNVLFSMSPFKQIRRFHFPYTHILSTALSKDGTMVAIFGYNLRDASGDRNTTTNGYVYVYKGSSRKTLRSIRIPRGPYALDMSFTKSGKGLWVADSNGNLLLFSVDSGSVLKRYKAKDIKNALLSMTAPRTPKITSSCRIIPNKTIGNTSSGVDLLSPNGQLAIFSRRHPHKFPDEVAESFPNSSSKLSWMFDLKKLQRVDWFKTKKLVSYKFASASPYLLLNHYGGAIVRYNLKSGKKVFFKGDFRKTYRSAIINSPEEYVIDMGLKLPKQGIHDRSYVLSKGAINGSDISPNGAYALTYTDRTSIKYNNSEIRLWRSKKMKQIYANATWLHHTKAEYNRVFFSENSKWVVINEELRELPSMKILGRFPFKITGRWGSARFSPDSRYIAVKTRSVVDLFDVATRKLLNTWIVDSCDHNPILFTPKGDFLLIGSISAITVFAPGKKEPVGYVPNPFGSIKQLVWKKTGRLISLHYDGSLTVWNTHTKNVLRRFNLYKDGTWVLTAPDGRWRGAKEKVKCNTTNSINSKPSPNLTLFPNGSTQ